MIVKLFAMDFTLSREVRVAGRRGAGGAKRRSNYSSCYGIRTQLKTIRVRD